VSGPGSNISKVSRQLGPVALVVAAALADGAGRSELAFYLLLAAVPVIAAAALAAYGEYVADGREAAQTVLWGLALLFVTTSAAVRAPVLGAVVPALGGATLIACLSLVGVQGALALVGELRRRH
jgi:hypothetical protein